MNTGFREVWITHSATTFAFSSSVGLMVYGYLAHEPTLFLLGFFTLFVFVCTSKPVRFSYAASLGSVMLLALIGFVASLSANNILTLETLAYVVGSSVMYLGLSQLNQKREAAANQDHQNQLQADNEFRGLADNIPILIWTATPDGTINYISNRISSFCGLPTKTILEDWLAVLHPDDREHTIASWQAAIQNAKVYETEYRIKRADGSYIWHSVQGQPIFNDNGDVTKWYGSSVDVQNLKVLQRKSEALVQRLNNTIESITDAFLTLDHEFRITYINKPAAAIIDKEPDELLGSVIWSHKVITEDDAFAIKFKEALHYQHSLRFEEFLVAKQRWLEVNVYPSFGGLTIYLNDITQNREERQELRLLRTAVSRLNDIILITEAEPFDEPGPRVVFVNEAFERRTGFSKDEVMGKTPRILQGENTQRDRLDKIRKALDTWQPVRTQLINYTKSGEEFWLELDIVPIADEKGWFTHWVAVERDITQQKQTEQQLLQAQKMESLGHVTGGIAHDFNNLLTVILGNAELLFENLPDNSPDRPLVETLLNAAIRGEKLTTSLLTFSSKQTLMPSKLNVNTLLVDLSTMLNTIMGGQHKLQLELAPELPVVMADEAHLESCIINLVINARDAMTTPGTVTITTEYKNAADLVASNELEFSHFVSVKVKDTGEGMSEQTKRRIFEPFFSTKKPGQGTGLGLSMVFGFARQTGGDVLVNSEPDKGATFELLLPCLETKTIEDKPGQTRHVRAQKEWRLLLVEDDAMVRQYAFDMLSKEGFKITEAETAIEALSIVKAGQQFDIVFTDIVMPGNMDGFQLSEQLNKIAPNLPILFTTGYSENAGQLHERIAQESYLLRKPYRKTELLQRLDTLLSVSPRQKAKHDL